MRSARAHAISTSIRGRLWHRLRHPRRAPALAGVVARRSFTGMSHDDHGSRSPRSKPRRSSRASSRPTSRRPSKRLALSRHAAIRRRRTAFRTFGWAAHDVQRQMNDRPNQSATEVAIVASIDNKLSAMEVDYALAHRLADLGRTDDAHGPRRQARGARSTICSATSTRLGTLKAEKVAAARSRSRRRNRSRRSALAASVHHRARARLRHRRRDVHRPAHRRAARRARAPRAAA